MRAKADNCYIYRVIRNMAPRKCAYKLDSRICRGRLLVDRAVQVPTCCTSTDWRLRPDNFKCTSQM